MIRFILPVKFICAFLFLFYFAGCDLFKSSTGVDLSNNSAQPPKPELLCITKPNQGDDKIEIEEQVWCQGGHGNGLKIKKQNKLNQWNSDNVLAEVNCRAGLSSKAKLKVSTACKINGSEEYTLSFNGSRAAHAGWYGDFGGLLFGPQLLCGKDDKGRIKQYCWAATKLVGSGRTGIMAKKASKHCLKILSHKVSGNFIRRMDSSYKHGNGPFETPGKFYQPKPKIIRLEDPMGNAIDLSKEGNSIPLNKNGLWPIKFIPDPNLSKLTTWNETSGDAEVEDTLRFIFLPENPDGTCP